MTDINDEQKEEILYRIRGEFDELTAQIVELMLDTDELLNVEEMEERLSEQGKNIDKKEIRQSLYGLNDSGYARSRRIRDTETGWIHFMWNLFPDKILQD